MSLRTRLTAAFLLVVLVPLAVGALLVTRAFPSSSASRERPAALTDARLVTQILRERCERARTTAEATGRLAATTTTANARAAADSFVRRGLVDGVAISSATGRTLFAVGTVPAGAADCTTGTGDQGLLAAVVPLLTAGGADAGTATASVSVVPTLVEEISGSLGDADVALVTASGAVVGATSGFPAELVAQALAHPEGTVVGQRVAAAVPAGPGQPYGVVVALETSRSGVVLLNVLLVLALALVIAVMIALLVARAVTRPLEELDAATARVAAGDLQTVLDVRSQDEMGRLAANFNAMTRDLRTYVEQLRAGRDDLRSGLARLGEMLAGSHDLDRILHVVLESAIAQTRAKSGLVLLLDGKRGHLSVAAAQGLELPVDLQLRLGEGVSGAVAATGEAVRGRTGHGPGELSPAQGEPIDTHVIAVPLKSSGRVIGVLDLFGSELPGGFDDEHLATMHTFAGQATIAIDNVLLHEEAQRLSLTDERTGLWNYRYFTTAMTRELERAQRFGRPLALVMIDLDHFKDVNDTFGHQRGDEVLNELAARIRGKAREVDTVARYGGEEIVLILPETDEAGARQAVERLCATVRRRPFGARGVPPVRLTISAGVAVYPQHGKTTRSLLASADAALYEAKHEGRDTYRVSGASTAG